MAWIKMKTDLQASVKVMQIAKDLGISNEDVLLVLYRVAGWFETQGKYGKVSNAPLEVVDLCVRTPGIANALMRVGWLRLQNGVISVHGFCAPTDRKSLGRAERLSILSGAVCTACGASDGLVIDHIIPIARGGSCDRSNLQPLCAPCNRSKGRKTMDEFMGAGRAEGGS